MESVGNFYLIKRSGLLVETTATMDDGPLRCEDGGQQKKSGEATRSPRDGVSHGNLFSKYGTRYHMFPNCQTIKESDVLERHVCKVCLRKVDQGESITVSDRDHLGPRCVSRGSPRIRPLRDQVCFWCGSADHFVKKLPASAVRRLPAVKSGEYLKKENEKMSYQKEHQKEYKYKDKDGNPSYRDPEALDRLAKQGVVNISGTNTKSGKRELSSDEEKEYVVVKNSDAAKTDWHN